ncbi:MAG: SemiSWEET family transporter [bacterium]
MIIFEAIGIIGSLIVCASAIPQVIKTYKTKRANDLSIVYLFILLFGIILLQIYSLYIRDFVFIFGNTLSLLTTGLLIVLWYMYRKN